MIDQICCERDFETAAPPSSSSVDIFNAQLDSAGCDWHIRHDCEDSSARELSRELQHESAELERLMRHPNTPHFAEKVDRLLTRIEDTVRQIQHGQGADQGNSPAGSHEPDPNAGGLKRLREDLSQLQSMLEHRRNCHLDHSWQHDSHHDHARYDHALNTVRGLRHDLDHLINGHQHYARHHHHHAYENVG